MKSKSQKKNKEKKRKSLSEVLKFGKEVECLNSSQR